MNPEKEIITWWLKNKGFFTINSIKAAKNKEIEILAIKLNKNKAEEVLHIETACSISSVDNFTPQQYIEKFEDKIIVKKLNQCIKDFVGACKYNKVLVLGLTHKAEDFKKLKDIKVYSFEDILCDVFVELNKQNYRDDTIRTLQLVKYILLANPEKLAMLIEKQGKNQMLNMLTREVFVKGLLKQNEVKRIIDKESTEKELIAILKNSSLKKPEKLAKTLIEDILTRRTRSRFIKYFIEHKDVKKIAKQIKRKKEKPLKYFFK